MWEIIRLNNFFFISRGEHTSTKLCKIRAYIYIYQPWYIPESRVRVMTCGRTFTNVDIYYLRSVKRFPCAAAVFADPVMLCRNLHERALLYTCMRSHIIMHTPAVCEMRMHYRFSDGSGRPRLRSHFRACCSYYYEPCAAPRNTARSTEL